MKICSLIFPPKRAICENFILLKPNSLGEILHKVRVRGSHQDLGSRTTLLSRALPINHTGVDENTQADPVLNLLSLVTVLKVAVAHFSRWLILRKNSPFPWKPAAIVHGTNEISDFWYSTH